MFDTALENLLNDKVTDFSEITANAGKKDITAGKNLDNLAGISLSISSPEKVRELSYGQVLISETINYRTQKPERGGLFCEQIFGPRKNYECSCGKYKRIRYKGVVCERCGVEVTKASARRERMGHIDLCAPVAHAWFMKSVPSRMGLLLDLPVRKLEQVIYFASYIITDVFSDKVKESLIGLEDRYKSSKAEMQSQAKEEINNLRLAKEEGKISAKELKEKEALVMRRIDDLDEEVQTLKDLLNNIKVGEVIGELDFRVLDDRFPHVFNAGTGAEHLKTLLERIDLKRFISERQEELKKSSGIKQKKILQKIKLASNLLKSNQRPEWFIMTALPIIPPDLRPMIQLDGGRFASSDLNDLYRRVINRNNRLKKLIELGAPEVILKNEKRMLQEAVDMLFTGESRTNRTGYVTANKRKLKSLTDILKGKQGRFRQNLLGKRVDYSARSVIVVGPKLKMDECGIPKTMALTLFKPFVIGKLIDEGHVYNVKHAERFIEEEGKEVWDALDEVIKGKYVLMNRAPTLHRLSVQAFRPVLIDGKSIQLHPLTCSAFNADFDGDQMAVHLPLTKQAQAEARNLMVTSKNLLSPASGEPIVSPSQDMVLGCYYLTRIDEVKKEERLSFSGIFDVRHAFDQNVITYHTEVNVRVNGKLTNTTYGRLLFNEIVPEGLGFRNETVGKNQLKNLLSECFDVLGTKATADLADKIKNLGYKYATSSGLSISKEDMMIPDNKLDILGVGEEKVREIQRKHWHGFLTDNEKYVQSIAIWADVKKVIEKEMKEYFTKENHIFNLVDSGARGNWGQVTQLCGMKGLVASTSGKTIELPIKSNLKEGFSPLEYFIATHGGRKGKSDTALKTAQSGYLTRRLVDAAQSIIVKEDDCKTVHYKEVIRQDNAKSLEESFEDKIFSRTLARDIVTSDGEVLAEEGDVIDKNLIDLINDNKINSVKIRSVLTCSSEGGVCRKCYGLDLGVYKNVEIGTPVGIIAAQSIGEPGTQLTMRTFHSGGVVKEGGDMSQGLTRVEELLEARTPKFLAEISSIDGEVSIKQDRDNIHITVVADKLEEEEYYFGDDFEVAVKEGQKIKEKQIIARNTKVKQKITSKFAGVVKKVTPNMIIIKDVDFKQDIHKVDLGTSVIVESGQVVTKGQRLTEGAIDVKELMNISGVLASQEYLINEIKKIYSSQGQTVNSKHVELIIRQMFSKVRILDKGDSDFFPGDIVDVVRFEKELDRLQKEGKKIPIGERLLLGLTKISLYMDSWLSAASFQETVRVLVEASVSSQIDKLKELKENVIIGRQIPAGHHYRKINGIETQNEENVVDGYFDDDELDDDEMRFMARAEEAVNAEVEGFSIEELEAEEGEV